MANQSSGVPRFQPYNKEDRKMSKNGEKLFRKNLPPPPPPPPPPSPVVPAPPCHVCEAKANRKRFIVDGNRHVFLNTFKGKIWLHLRDYIRRTCKTISSSDDHDGCQQDTIEYIPVKGRGIALTVTQWETLKKLQKEIDAELDCMIQTLGNNPEDSKHFL